MSIQTGFVLIAFFAGLPFDVYDGPPYERLKAIGVPHGSRLDEVFGSRRYYTFIRNGCLHTIHTDKNIPEVVYETPEEGDILPVFGRMYRVKSGPSPIVLEKIAFDDVPEKLVVDANSVVVPRKWNGNGDTSLSLRDTKKKRGSKEKVSRTLTLELANVKQHELGLTARLHYRWRGATDFKEVRVGDLVTFDEHRFQVRNIVPRDEEKHITGWLELTRLPAEGENTKSQ